MSIKIYYFSKFIKLKDLHIKTEAENKDKKYRNLISTLLKWSKQSYFTKLFQDNIKNLKNTWKVIKSVISNQTSPNAITDNHPLLTDSILVIQKRNFLFSFHQQIVIHFLFHFQIVTTFQRYIESTDFSLQSITFD